MRFLTDDEISDVRADALAAGSEIDQTDLWDEINWDERSLADLVILRASFQALLDETDRRIAVRVNEGRFAGGSWAEIGKILGISRQAAQQKFGG